MAKVTDVQYYKYSSVIEKKWARTNIANLAAVFWSRDLGS